MATIKFLLQGKSESSSIYIRLSIGRNNTPKRKTGLSISPKEWSEKTGFPKQNNAHNKKMKSSLEKLQNHISDRYNEDYANGAAINGDWLTTEIDNFFDQGKNKTDLNIITEYIKHFISTAGLKRNSKGGLGLSESRINDYKILNKIISEYQGKTPLLVKDINLNFRDEFVKWMIDIKQYSKGYTGRMLGTLKTICLDAEVNDIETHKQLKKVAGFKVSNEHVIYLTTEELEKIKKTQLPHPYLENAKKWLLLGCDIGQRGNDILNLSEENESIRNGLKVLELKQQKTGKNIAIPILSNAEKVINEGWPRKISLQRFNDYIKEVCRLSGITTLTTGKKINPETKRHEVGEFQKWELVTSHICRRSFATNLYGILPTPLIMQITGHSSEKMFYGYIGKNSYDYAQQIADFYAKQAIKQKKEPQLNIIKNASN